MILAEFDGADPDFDIDELVTMWAAVKRESVTNDELAKRRDTSAEAHRRCWLDLYRPFNALHSGAAEALYLDQPNPLGWQPFDDTRDVLETLSARDVPIGVVSDTELARANNCSAVRTIVLDSRGIVR